MRENKFLCTNNSKAKRRKRQIHPTPGSQAELRQDCVNRGSNLRCSGVQVPLDLRTSKGTRRNLQLFSWCSGYCTVRLIVVVWLNAPEVAVTTIEAVPRFV